MKLVELLARELKEWPERTVEYVQGKDGCWPLSFSGARFEGSTWILKTGQTTGSGGDVLHIDMASDYKKARVTRAQWQAERDRQKGGEWKRHRGRKIPVSAESVVDVKLDTGEVMSGEIAGDWEWSHTDAVPRIMQYRIISQPQAEEVEVKDTTIGTLSYKVEIDTTEATQAIDDLAAKWDQIETPFKWRDEVTELNAYIEKYTRERDALIERLASEGFALIPAMTPVMGVAEISIPYPEWEIGDIIEVVSTDGFCNSSVRVGDQYPISHKDSVDVKGPTGTFGDEDNYKFIRRP